MTRKERTVLAKRAGRILGAAWRAAGRSGRCPYRVRTTSSCPWEIRLYAGTVNKEDVYEWFRIFGDSPESLLEEVRWAVADFTGTEFRSREELFLWLSSLGVRVPEGLSGK